MLDPPANASVSPSLTLAHTALCEALEVGKRDFNAYGHFSNGGDICLGIEAFVGEFCRVPEWRAQLKWRADFVRSNTGSGSAYSQAMGAALKAYRSRAKKAFGPEFPIERQYFSALRKAPALVFLVDELHALRRKLDSVIKTKVLRPQVEAAFVGWLSRCRLIQRESQHLEADGCYYLYHICQADEPRASEWSKELRAGVERGTVFGGLWFKPIRNGADSLAAWAAENLACAPSAELGGGNDRKRLTRDEFNVFARDYLKDHATPDHRVIAQELADYLKGRNPVGTCSTSTVGNLAAWRVYQDKLEMEGEKGRKKKPKALSLTKTIEATTGQDDIQLKRLLGEQREDMEPSPLEEDPSDAPPRSVRERKQV